MNLDSAHCMNGTSGTTFIHTNLPNKHSDTYPLKIHTHTETQKLDRSRLLLRGCLALTSVCLSKQCFELRVWMEKFMLLSLVLLSSTLWIHIYLTAKDTEKHTETAICTHTICIHTLWEPWNDTATHRLPLISVNGRFSPLILGPFLGF